MEKIPPLVFHADWFDIIENLPQEQQLEVYRAIMLYAFRGELSDNPIAMAATALMRKFVDADRKKYAEISQKRKEAIMRRWQVHKNTNVYNSIHKNTSDTNTNTNTNTNTKTINQYQDQYQEAIDKSIPSAANIPRTGAGGAAAPELRAKIAELKKGEIWLTQVAMKFHVTTDEVCRQLDEFCDEMELRGRQVNSPQGLFVTWLGDRKYGSKPRSPSQTDPGLGIGEFRNGKGQRTYGTGGVIVPESAPPRPSEAHWWSDSSKLWEKTI